MKKYVVEICVGTSCHLMGGQSLFDAIHNLPEEILAQIHLKSSTCLHACGRGPAVRINGELFAPITPHQLIEKLRR